MAREQVKIGDLIEYYVDHDDDFFGLKAHTVYKVSVVDNKNYFMLEGTTKQWWALASPFRYYSKSFKEIINSADKTDMFRFIQRELDHG